ncbi:MAG TPA: aldehyde dehydrogenase family protein [Candidatus Aminicenantes bacterium]|nr:aldehyde dehydrogenase family protein [Candidatus Aminicenantes bacterium]HRY64032.1 aldehyde dehydrogenase family protein [Candidatus Aminicenantes bacterium]HRZ70945.1 aldehyde dehydrogenase family protein [Candidatus Aminicenantes bacterium]
MKMLLAGEWVDRAKAIEVRDPFDNSLIDTVPRADAADADKAMAAAAEGFETARRMTVYDRAQVLFRTARIVEGRLEDFATTIAREGSKTIREARKEARRCVNTLTASAEEAKRIQGETIPFSSFPGGEKRRGYYERVPIGIVLAITPFNDPLNLVAHKLGPAVAAGNSVVLKPATVTPLSGIKLVEAFMEAGLPPLIMQVITGYGAEIGDALVADPRPRMISFTGGVEAGLRITKLAGLKKIGMELGSNSPVIVWRDADIEWAAETCVSGAFWAAGQNCIGVQRIYVHRDVYEPFRKRFVEITRGYKIGDKLKEETDMGPMITEGEARRLEGWVREAEKAGARVLAGRRREGALLEPTVLENVPKTAKVHAEEVFGPTVNLYQVDDADQALAEANGIAYGLHAALFTRDVDMAFKLAYGLDCGGVMINDSTDYRLDSMPFGGVKNSGLGREGIKFSLQEMTEPKVICWYLPKS